MLTDYSHHGVPPASRTPTDNGDPTAEMTMDVNPTPSTLVPAPMLIVPAAGAGRRMGQAKALTEIAGRTFLEHIIHCATAAGCGPVLVVTGAQAERVRERHSNTAVGWVHNHRWEHTGMLESVLCALPRLCTHAPCLIWPVDCPLVSPLTLQELQQAGTNAAPPRAPWAIQPSYLGRPGHPLWLAPTAWSLLPVEGLHLQAFLRRFATRRRQIPVDDPHVVGNINTPEDLARALP